MAGEDEGEATGVNEGEAEEEYGYRLFISQFNLAMEDCSQKGKGGVISVTPAPKN